MESSLQLSPYPRSLNNDTVGPLPETRERMKNTWGSGETFKENEMHEGFPLSCLAELRRGKYNTDQGYLKRT